MVLQNHQVQQFQSVLEERWKSRAYGDLEQSLSDFKDAMQAAQSTLPPAPEGDSADWVTEEVRDLSRRSLAEVGKGH